MVDITKSNGVVYTPDWIIEIIHDAGLPKDLRDVSICDPACGDGAFLVDVVDRICQQAIASKDKNPYLLSLKNLTGFDIDTRALRECTARLTTTLKKYFPKIKIKWNLHNIDGIDQDQHKPWIGKFDCIVGNPPYVRIQHLEQDRRELIRKGKWDCLSGCTDLYMLFFEYGLNLLKDHGSLCYITPNSWLKSNAGKKLREYLSNYQIDYLLDFSAHQVFKSVTTYTSITKIQKSAPEKPSRVDRFTEGQIVTKNILVSYKDKWFVAKNRPNFLLDSSTDTVLGELAKINVGIQCLADRVFILPVNRYEEDLVICEVEGDAVSIEKDIVRKIYKASVMRDGKDKVDRIIIYPYDENGSLMSEQEIKQSYPCTYDWLTQNKSILLNRDKGVKQNYKWYEYGRSVGIKSGFGVKILTSSMNVKPNFQLCEDEGSLFYSGYGIKAASWVDLNKLVQELNSVRMEQYIDFVSKPFRQGWRSYAKSFIQDYPIDSSQVAL